MSSCGYVHTITGTLGGQGHQIPAGAGVSSRCELLDMGAGDCT